MARGAANIPGGFSKPEGFRFPRWAIVSVVAAGIAISLGLSLYDRVLNVRDATLETGANAIAGPPCPTVTAADFKARQLETRYASEFNGLTFNRRFGQVSCSEVANGAFGVKSYSVCQFSGPDVLAVKTPTGMSFFNPGIGRKASILVPHGAPQCVMAAPDWS
jgi:hypothetical protein